MLPIPLALLKTMRPKQWAKNAFLFVAITFDRQLLPPGPPLARTLAGFALFCLISSTVYIINDLVDIEADRQHPREAQPPAAVGKTAGAHRHRGRGGHPADGRLPAGLSALVELRPDLAWDIFCSTWPIPNGSSTFLSWMCSCWPVFMCCGWGQVLSSLSVTPFLALAVRLHIFLALFLGVGKRRAELNLLADAANSHRPVLEGYTLPLLDQLMTIVSSMTIITYSLYTFLGGQFAR